MQRYANSKFRILLLILMLGAAITIATTSFGQDAAGGAAPAGPVKTQGLFSLITGHIDFVFVIIATLSVAGLTLIIQGFIQNRSEAMMPEATTQRIRDMIEARQFRELIEFTENDP